MDGEVSHPADRALRSGSLSMPDVSNKHGGHRPEFRPGEDAYQRQRGRSEFCASRSGDGFARPSTDREGGEPAEVHSRPSRAGGVPQLANDVVFVHALHPHFSYHRQVGLQWATAHFQWLWNKPGRQSLHQSECHRIWHFDVK